MFPFYGAVRGKKYGFFPAPAHSVFRVMKMKDTLTAKLAGHFDLPEEAAGPAPRITISGSGRVLVEGHRGLLEYGEDKIAAAGAGCTILIKGEKLRMRSMSGRELVVTGRLWAVELE